MLHMISSQSVANSISQSVSESKLVCSRLILANNEVKINLHSNITRAKTVSVHHRKVF